MTRTPRAPVLLAALLLCGCYQYFPVAPDAIPPDQELRVFLSRRALAELPEGIPTSTNYVEGRLVRATADSLLLMVPVSRTVDGPGARDLRQNVYVPKLEVVDVQRRHLSRPRTALTLLGGVAAGLILVQAADTDASEPPNQAGSEGIRIPLDAFGR
jgi:hypothetical protein